LSRRTTAPIPKQVTSGDNAPALRFAKGKDVAPASPARAVASLAADHVLAPDEDQAPGGARSEPFPLLHPRKAAVSSLVLPSMRMGARDVGTSHRCRAAGFLVARIGVARREVPPGVRAAGGGRSAREKGSLDALSDARGGIMSGLLLDAAGRRRSPATLPDFHAGRPPREGIRYPADPPKVEEAIAVMRTAGDGVHGRRLHGLIVVLSRAGLRIHEALALTEADARRGSLLVRRGNGGRRREVRMDDRAWEQLEPWLKARVELPIGPPFCVVNGPNRGRPWSPRRRARTCGMWRTAAACPRRRHGARRRAADRHPTATRAHQPRHHVHR
jgi:hypothetical protein